MNKNIDSRLRKKWNEHTKSSKEVSDRAKWAIFDRINEYRESMGESPMTYDEFMNASFHHHGNGATKPKHRKRKRH